MNLRIPGRRAGTVLATVLAMAAVAAARAEPVSIERQGLKLNAFYEAPPPGAPVVLMLHGTLAHGDMEIMRTLRELFRDAGWGALSVSLGLAEDDRHGMYPCDATHRHLASDASRELGWWMDWLAESGAERTVLLGHSRGGLEMAVFAAGPPRPGVEALVLIAPPATVPRTAAERYRGRHDDDLEALRDRAQALVEQGEGDAVLEHVGFLHCGDARVTAASFLSYYGAGAPDAADTLLGTSPYPVLVIAGSEDQVVPGLADSMGPVLDPPRIQLVEIDGADHFFRDLYADDVVAAVRSFVAAEGGR